MKDKRQLKFVSIQSKVSPETAERIDKIVNEYGFGSRYELMQYLLSAFLKYADKEMEESDQLNEFAKIFEGYQNKKNRIITTRPGGNRNLKLTESINIFSEVGRKGYVCKRIVIAGEKESVTSNSENAVRSIMRKLFPQIAGYIESIGNEIGECNYIKILEYVIESRADDEAARSIRSDFEKLKQKPNYGRVPVRSKIETIDKYE
jgi:hypothetical protein